MAAPSGYRTWATSDTVTASDFSTFVQDQTVGVYTSSSNRSSELASPAEGQVSFLTDSNTFEVYNGSAWVALLDADTISVSSGNYTITSDLTVDGGDLSVSGTITQNSVVGRVSPSGSIVGFGGSSAPTGWLLCDGSAVSRTTYSDLFSAISTAYGVGDGSTTFNVPNLKGKVPVGLDAADGSFDALAETGGASTITLATSDIPAHTHTQNAHGHTQNAHTHTQNSHTHLLNSPVDGGYIGSTIGGFGSYYTRMNIGDSTNLLWIATATTAVNQNTTATNQNTTATNTNTGGGGAHSNLQPYVVINYIIAI